MKKLQRGRNKNGAGRYHGRFYGLSEKLTTIAFACAAAVVILIALYRSLPETAMADKTAEVSGENMMAADGGTVGTVEISEAAVAEEPAKIFRAETDVEMAMESGNQTSRSETERMNSEEIKRVALTFDDGPHPVCTPKLLDGLKERGVSVTFFVIGKNIPGNEDIIRRMDEEGHLIGNHTYDHVKISDLSVEAACEQVEKTSALIYEITGKNTEYVRPPFGSWSKDLECSFEMFPVLWDVDPLDWTTKNTGDVVRRVLEAVEPDDIILLHDCYESSVDAALQIVDALTEQGYVFVTVDELILE
ncbi:MAG: polysaccharide deacetylase family protein [Clostridiales bacterium]|nr:polysaccharide deacetylase family protein [Clostridiales bacterium]